MKNTSAEMPMNLSWDDLRLILAVVRGETLAGAASRLNLDSSTVFRSIKNIEQKLKVPLFERSRQGYSPTPLGEVLAQTAERIEREILNLEVEIAGKQAIPSGHLRVSTTDTVLYTQLIPHLKRFATQFPGVSLDLIASNEMMNLNRRDVDIVIRVTATPPEHLVGRSLGAVRFRMYASCAHWEQHQYLPLQDHVWLALDDSLGNHPTNIWRQRYFPNVVPTYRFNSMFGLCQAIQSGAGIGILSTIHERVDPTLIPLGDPIDDIDLQLWILTHPDLRKLSRVRAFMEYCSEILPAVLE